MTFWILGLLVVAVILYFIGFYAYCILKIVFGGPWGH